eukprot:scaffold194206_cov21-Tisochrysis_lutea.AAC.1
MAVMTSKHLDIASACTFALEVIVHLCHALLALLFSLLLKLGRDVKKLASLATPWKFLEPHSTQP